MSQPRTAIVGFRAFVTGSDNIACLMCLMCLGSVGLRRVVNFRSSSGVRFFFSLFLKKSDRLDGVDRSRSHAPCGLSNLLCSSSLEPRLRAQKLPTEGGKRWICEDMTAYLRRRGIYVRTPFNGASRLPIFICLSILESVSGLPRFTGHGRRY